MKQKIIKAIKLLLYRRPHVHLSVSYVSPANRFAEKNVMVTGATSGIGLAIAKAFLAEGANVIMCARKEEGFEKIKSVLDKRAKFLQMDISDIPSLQGKISEASSIITVEGGVKILTFLSMRQASRPMTRIA